MCPELGVGIKNLERWPGDLFFSFQYLSVVFVGGLVACSLVGRFVASSSSLLIVLFVRRCRW
jgi:hypothetical protein